MFIAATQVSIDFQQRGIHLCLAVALWKNLPLFGVRSWNNGMHCMSLYSYQFVIWPDCFEGLPCRGGFRPEPVPLSLTCSIITMLGTVLMIFTGILLSDCVWEGLIIILFAHGSDLVSVLMPPTFMAKHNTKRKELSNIRLLFFKLGQEG